MSTPLVDDAAPGRAGTPDDAVAGVVPAWVARPESIEQSAAVLRACAAAGMAVVARGGGSKLDWGAAPARLDVLLDTTGLTGIAHTAGDLVVRVGAGVPLARLQEVLAAAGQELALDQPVPGAPGVASTVGGMAATGVSGPRRLLRGSPRDLVIGARLVRSDGVTARAGGQVVKNVAGYDLARLACGSYGTLALIAELTFRLHPVPQSRRWVELAALEPAEVFRATRVALGSPVVPAAVEVWSGGAGRGSGSPSEGYSWAAMLEGSAVGVAGRAVRLAGMLAGPLGERARVVEGPPDGWGLFPGGADDILLKLTADLPGVTRLLTELGSEGGTAAVRGSAGAGVLHAALPAGTGADRPADRLARLRRVAATAGGSVVVLRAPAAVRDRVDLWGPIPALDLMRRVKAQFDPQRLLAPGRFVGGI